MIALSQKVFAHTGCLTMFYSYVLLIDKGITAYTGSHALTAALLPCLQLQHAQVTVK